MSDNKHSNITMTIKNINIYGKWSYNTENKDCGICRHDLQIPTINSKYGNKINGSVIIGLCQHGFHENCINSWLSDDNISCPICRNVWKPAKNVGNTVYVYKN